MSHEGFRRWLREVQAGGEALEEDERKILRDLLLGPTTVVVELRPHEATHMTTGMLTVGFANEHPEPVEVHLRVRYPKRERPS